MATPEKSQRPLLPFYLIVDVSYSMAGPSIDAANEIVGEVANALVKHPLLADKVRVSVVEFSDTAQIVLPLTDLTTLTSIPQFSVRTSTSYAAAFGLLGDLINKDVDQLKNDGFRVHRACAFFVTDGEPTDKEKDWKGAFSKLTDYDKSTRAGNSRYPNVVPFGVETATEETIQYLVHPNGKMRGFIQGRDETDAAAAIGKVAKIITMSVLSSAEDAAAGEGGQPNWGAMDTEGLVATDGFADFDDFDENWLV